MLREAHMRWLREDRYLRRADNIRPEFGNRRPQIAEPVGIGDLVVRVPDDVTVRVDARAGAGQVTLFGKTSDGRSVHEQTTEVGSAPARVIVLDARVGLGQLEVQRG